MSVPNTSLATPIIDWLKNEIDQGHLEPGAKLLSEKQLCERFGVSRSVVREALSQLKSEGLVNAYQGRGVFVAERGSRQSFRLKATSLRDTEAIAHIIELMSALETAAARYAALRHSAGDLKRIRQALVGMDYAIVHDQPGDEEDYAFHQAIVDATHNPQFVALNEYLEQHARRLIRQARNNTATYHQDLIADVQKEHLDIFQAIERRDPLAAAQAAETHLNNAARRLNIYQGGADTSAN
ncbi:MAG: FadR family transcriptional regulator [Alcaligenaceae bacterium]|nr:FadR family transcriptional regulator [Alcaligenaceae bacterium]